MSSHALDRLLPYAEPGIQVNGVMGLRVVDIDGADLHLGLVNSKSRTNARYMRQCTYNLEHIGDQLCGLQIRFRSGPTVYGKNVREELKRLGADNSWLDRVLPTGDQSVTGEAGR